MTAERTSRQIFLANPKGGSGKTTIATQLASYFARQGARVALVDHDQQQSSLDWLKARPKQLSPITAIAQFKGQDYDPQAYAWGVHDMPAACTIEHLQNAVVNDAVLLIPILPSPTDIKAGVRFLMALNRDPWVSSSGLRIGLIANRVRANTHYFKVLVTFLEQINMPLITSIRDTQNYIRAMDGGVSIFDLPPSRVAMDVASWQPLIDWLQAQVPADGLAH